MKLKVIGSPDKYKPVFKPIKLEIELNTLEETRLLFHVLNRYDLLDVLKKTSGYEFSSYSAEIANMFDDEAFQTVFGEIQRQGLEV